MRAKEYLGQIQNFEYSIYIAQEAIQRVKDRLDIKGVNYSFDNISGSSEDILPDLIAKLIKLEEATEQKRTEYEVIRLLIISQINAMEDILDKRILYSRYVEGKNLYSISKQFGYSYDWIRHRHGRALQKFEETFSPLEKYDFQIGENIK